MLFIVKMKRSLLLHFIVKKKLSIFIPHLNHDFRIILLKNLCHKFKNIFLFHSLNKRHPLCKYKSNINLCFLLLKRNDIYSDIIKIIIYAFHSLK